MGEILIGTSGFSYDDWKGGFYPEKIPKGDMLRFYAERFTTVEVNSSFYAITAPATFERMADRTPDDFEFVVKAFKGLTHESEVDAGIFRQFLDSIQPLVDRGKFGCILVQYPWGFKAQESNLDRLRQLRDEFAGLPVVVEFRNVDWLEKHTFDLLREKDLGFCCVDEPHLKGLMPGIVEATSRIGYVRFHGRNFAKWWSHEESWQRYDYLYSPGELQEWIPKVRDLSSKTEKTYLFFNNHYQGKSAANAVQFASMLAVPGAGRTEQ